MPRLNLIEAAQAPLKARPYYAKGDPGSIVKSLAHVPELLTATSPFLGAMYSPSAVPVRLKEIVILRMSVLEQCLFCVRTHTAVALGCGFTRAEIDALRGEASAVEAFTDPGERALVVYTEALAGVGEIPAEIADAVAEHFTDAERVELTLLAGATLMLNRYCTAFQLPVSMATMDRLEEAGLA